MIVKVVFGNNHTHMRIVECTDIHLEEKKTDDGEHFTELICHKSGGGDPCIIHLGKGTKDYLYIMDKGKTADRMEFQPVKQ